MRYQPIECILTAEQVEALCAEWQERLRLQDWQIVVRIERAHVLGGTHDRGRIYYTKTNRQATIRLLAAQDYPPDSHFPCDMEQTLVHELLHLHRLDEDHEDGTHANDLLEFGVDATAQALVQLKREAQRVAG